MNANKLIVSECVSHGHPDKIADQIADALLDAYLANDKHSRCGIEVMIKDNVVVLGGEVHSKASIDYDNIVRSVINSLSFSKEHKLGYSDIKIINLIGQQSEEIHNGVDKEVHGLEEETVIGAGDQGFMVGFASDETPTFMPLGMYLARKICEEVSHQGMLGPDAKTQVIVEYNDDEAIRIHSILVSVMHPYDTLQNTRLIVEGIINGNKMNVTHDIYDQFIKGKDVKITVNPCGEWKVGGPVSDCGVTGRKLVVDSYGGYCNIGGGNYSGKDMSKVDRSAAYMARYLAKNIVASGWCNEAKVTLSYMIGVPEPCSLTIETDNQNDERSIRKLTDFIKKKVDLTPKGIIKRFNGDMPIYKVTSSIGHFGHVVTSDMKDTQITFKWECLDLADEIDMELLRG